MSADNPSEGPIRLIVQQPPSAHAENGDVVLTLTVFEVGQPRHAREIQAVMVLDDAKHAVVQLRRAIDEVTENRQPGT
jgi:hypothetical protein